MDGILIGVIGFIVLVIIFLLRMPVGFAMAFVGVLGLSYLISPEVALYVLARDFFSIFSSYSLTVIPMFTLMGCIASESGMSRRLYDAGYVLFGKFPGGLALATVLGCAGFAAINGSTSATAAALGKVCWYPGNHDPSEHDFHRLWHPDRTINRQTFYIRGISWPHNRSAINGHSGNFMLAQSQAGSCCCCVNFQRKNGSIDWRY